MADGTRALFMLFGGTGDLALRKLYPALFNLYKKGSLSKHFALLGLSRKELSDEEFRAKIMTSIADETADQQVATEFVSHFYWKSHDVNNMDHYQDLKKIGNQLDDQYQTGGNRVFYVSMAPRFFGIVAQNLQSQHVLSENGGFNRLVIEKPFGRDYQSAKELNDQLNSGFQENQIFRIDHYLGKETVEAIPVLRFGNPLLEAVWNQNYIKDVQITLAESLGVEDRAGYYDTAGALRDMIQNHTLQIVSYLAMDQPNSFVDTAIRAEKVKALESMEIYTDQGVKDNFVRGQYAGDEDHPDYRHESGVPVDSNNDTFAAGKIVFNNPRWGKTPFYIRSGKKLADKQGRVDIEFKKPLVDIFAKGTGTPGELQKNVLTLEIDPRVGLSLTINTKDSKQGLHTETVPLDYLQSDNRAAQVPLPYERLFHDILNGDGTYFASWPEVAAAWHFVDPVQQVWDTQQPDFPNYQQGSMGPTAADELLARDGNAWFYRGTK
ncbi:Glucose-6-phosphate 1-dehydrogenase [Fructilactobacillus florum 8D]|uniref:Glucose-6-phosphate 1-dehydrogenase n=1 Tax=Fructilactobacillus florum 8D TaxID=1221538 RepID=W9EIA2_9LACO|nr:glucose-6-phosphate dehydrogenase [Fructilactobacillus florum]EKK20462.1 Glucose-6-phosphate 1-dehydrogenase [Fructilactobacillus florum 2F]ETO40981.1 Glucose-6-phosphate 1-dehydrogenase [Fructilactobacillus florum 8D]